MTWVLHHLSEKVKHEFVGSFWAPFAQYEALKSKVRQHACPPHPNHPHHHRLTYASGLGASQTLASSDPVPSVENLFINAVTTAHEYYTRMHDAVKALDRCLGPGD